DRRGSSHTRAGPHDGDVRRLPGGRRPGGHRRHRRHLPPLVRAGGRVEPLGAPHSALGVGGRPPGRGERGGGGTHGLGHLAARTSGPRGPPRRAPGARRRRAARRNAPELGLAGRGGRPRRRPAPPLARTAEERASSSPEDREIDNPRPIPHPPNRAPWFALSPKGGPDVDKPTIQTRNNGPYLVKGPIHLVDGDGKEFTLQGDT